MAARYNALQLDMCREKIKVSQLLTLLQNNAFGKVTIDAIRQRSAEICLRKALPDLSATEITGSIASYVARLPSPAVDSDAWLASVNKPMLATSVIPSDEQAVDIVDVPYDVQAETDDYKPSD